MNRRYISMILTGSLLASAVFTACAGEGESETAATSSAPAAESAEVPAEELTTEPNQEPTAEPTMEPTTEPTQEPEDDTPAIRSVGEASDDAWSAVITNSTGYDIINIAVKNTTEEKFPKNYLKDGAVISDGEDVMLYFSPASDTSDPADAAETEAAEIPDAEEKELRETYDLKVVLDDGTEKGTKYVLSAFPFEDLALCEILFRDGVCYIEYESISTGEAISTFEAENALARRIAEEKEAEEEAARQAAEAAEAEEAARQAAEAAAAEEAARQAAEAAAAEEAARQAAEAAAAEEAARQAEAAQQQESEGCIEW